MQAVLYERRGPAAWITLNRPDKLNALNEAVVLGVRGGGGRGGGGGGGEGTAPGGGCQRGPVRAAQLRRYARAARVRPHRRRERLAGRARLARFPIREGLDRPEDLAE